MTDSQKVDKYIEKHSKWSEQLLKLRGIFHQTDLKEEVKWGSPTYTIEGKLVAGIAGFKNHYALWFHQGVFLADKEKMLVNAQEEKTKAMRQWRFEEGDPINEKLVLKYLNEAKENALAGKQIKPKQKKGVEIPPILNTAFKENPKLKTAFEQLTPGRQREFADHIGEAKREATQQSRLQKATPLILEGKGLYDKYKNC